jgi:hypothetical protein
MVRRIFWPLLAALAAWVLWRLVRMRSAQPVSPAPFYPDTRAYDQSIDSLTAPATTTVEELPAYSTPPDLLGATAVSTPETPLPAAADSDSLPPLDAPGMLAETEPSSPAEPAAPDMAEPPDVQPIEQEAGDVQIGAHVDEQTLDTAPGAQAEQHPVADVEPTAHIDEQTLDTAPGAQAEQHPVADVEPATAPQPVTPVSAADAAAEDTGEILTDLDVYCVRCREHRTLTNARVEITTRGRRAARGVCPVCGANVFTFLTQHD